MSSLFVAIKLYLIVVSSSTSYVGS